MLNILRCGVNSPVQPSPNLESPPKRRKLSRVPAGAADWDVPYPFPPGEGPPNYKEEWSNERCERLISDFITLLREGTNKAVARASTQRASSQPAPQSSTQSNPTTPRRSLPPMNGNHRSPSSNYVPLSLDAYLRPTMPRSYAASATPATTQPVESHVDLFTSMFGAATPPPGGRIPDLDPFDSSIHPLLPGFDLESLLSNLMGTGPPREGPSGIASPAPSEASTPALSHSPYPSQSVASGPSPTTPSFDPFFPSYSPPPPSSAACQQERVGILGPTHFLGPQGGMELDVDMDVDDGFGRVFGFEGDAPCEPSVETRPPHFCDPASVQPPAFLGAELSTQGLGSANTQTSCTLQPSAVSRATLDVPAFFPPQDPLPSFSNAFTTTSLQRQRPVPKRPAPPIPPSRSKAAETLVVAKKRREDVIQQARDLRRQLLADIGESKVQLWELTMEQGALTRISKDERLTKSGAQQT